MHFQPEEDDPKRVELSRGLPDGVVRATISYHREGGFRGTRVVPRSEAEFAQLTESGGPDSPRSNAAVRLTLSEAKDYLAQVQRRIEDLEDEIKRRHEAVDLVCSCSGRQRSYLGVLGFVVGHRRMLTDMPQETSQRVVDQHAYQCDQCGSMLFFAAGILAHPLPGGPSSRDRR